MKSVLSWLLRGLGLGVFVATGFTVWVTILRISQGTVPFDRVGTAYGDTVLFYYGSFAIGGMLAGVLWPVLHRWLVGWMLLGCIFVAPVYVAFVIVGTSPAGPLSIWKIVGVLFGAVVVGGLVGLRSWSLSRNRWKESRTNWRFVAILVLAGALLAAAMYIAWW